MKDREFRVVVLCGGISPEREVSLRSGAALFASYAKRWPAAKVVLDAAAIPGGLDPARDIVMSVCHGVFGEDGSLQELLDKAGFAYGGCDAASSRTCFDKGLTKDAAARAGVRTIPDFRFDGAARPDAAALVARLGPDIAIKPACQGSSVGLSLVCGEAEVAAALAACTPGPWVAEQRIFGRETTIGILDGRALGVVEIKPKGGAYDYKHKYTAGMTEYEFPARIPDSARVEIERFGVAAFDACGCRDFARVDFLLDAQGLAWFLEVNTLPGLTETSLLPKSASCRGFDFDSLADAMLEPAIRRFKARA